jgi:tetratricopeptide (TPR) repeat protein
LLGRWEEAIPFLKACLSRYPDVVWSHAWLAIDYYNLGDHGAARVETRQVERLVDLTPNSAVGYSALAGALNEQGQPVEALVAAEKGVRVDPQNRVILWELGLIYDELGRREESASALKHYVAVSLNDPYSFLDIWAHAFLVEDYAALGQMDAARQEAAQVERIAELDPNSIVRYFCLAITLESLGKDAEALVELEKTMRLDPFHRAHCLWTQGRVYSQLGRWEDAISAFKSFLGRYPQLVLPHVELAVDYIEVGRDDDARAEVAEALRLDPQFSLKMGVEGEVHMDKERVAADLRKAGLK